LIISLIGNACADYALIWYGISKISTSKSDHSISIFYLGQSIGVILLAPFLSVLFDRRRRLQGSISLDVAYAGLLLLMILLYRLDVMLPMFIFMFSMATAAIAIVHKSSVGYAAVQRMSSISGVTSIVGNFVSAYNFSILCGSAISGIVYRHIGFSGCMLLGAITFIPMPFIYWRLFAHDPEPEPSFRVSTWLEFKAGMRQLKRDTVLLATAFIQLLVNAASSILPAVIGISFEKFMPGRTDLSAMGIAIGIAFGILLTKPLGYWGTSFPLRWITFFSVAPSLSALMIVFIYPKPIMFCIVYALHCMGSALRGVTSGSLRVSRIPESMIGRVNTIYGIILHLGQIIGGLLIVPLTQVSLRWGACALTITLGLAAALGLAALPYGAVKTFLQSERSKKQTTR